MSISEITSSSYSNIYSVSSTDEIDEVSVVDEEDDESEEDFAELQTTSTTTAYTYSISSVSSGTYGTTSTLYSWSTTLYSEDRAYILYTDDDRNIIEAKSTTAPSGLTISEIAEQLASGADVDSADFQFLLQLDEELCIAASKIRAAKAWYEDDQEKLEEGTLSEDQFNQNCTDLFDILFGDEDTSSLSTDELIEKADEYFSQDAWYEDALENYGTWQAIIGDGNFLS